MLSCVSLGVFTKLDCPNSENLDAFRDKLGMSYAHVCL